jgi:hypothetical protein
VTHGTFGAWVRDRWKIGQPQSVLLVTGCTKLPTFCEEESPMREVMATANLVGSDMLESDRAVTAVIPRHEIEAAVHGGDPIGLWFDLANENDGEAVRLTVELPATDVEEALRVSTGDDVAVRLDARSLTALYDDSDVEAHGLGGALAIAVVIGAVAAPAGLAAKPEVASTALKPQTAHTALKPHVVRTALKPQVVRGALKPQVARTDLKPQVANRDVTRPMVRLVITAAGVNAWR